MKSCMVPPRPPQLAGINKPRQVPRVAVSPHETAVPFFSFGAKKALLDVFKPIIKDRMIPRVQHELRQTYSRADGHVFKR